MSKRRQKKKQQQEAEAPTWRAIRQKGVKRSSSTAARKRRWARLGRWLGLGLIASVILAGIGYAVYFSGQHFASIESMPKKSHLRQVDFSSNGVLDRNWFERQYPIPRDVAALDFDVFAFKQELERFGQIDHADVSISLPSTLNVRLREREPVLRARVRDPQGEVKLVLIATDGTVYPGEQYPAETLRRLPGLTDARLQWDQNGIRPVPGMDLVAALLRMARDLTPELYADWQLVSFERFSGDTNAPEALIYIKSGFIERIVFAPHSFESQLRKLNEVVMIAKEQQSGGLRKVDLSFGDQAIVQQ